VAQAVEAIYFFAVINAVFWAAVNGVAVRVFQARTGSYSAALDHTWRAPVFRVLVAYLALGGAIGTWLRPGIPLWAGLALPSVAAVWGFYTASRYVPPEMP